MISFFGGAYFVFGQQSQAEVILQTADTAIYQAFDAILDAEQAGSNVDSLVAQLSGSVDLLAQARTAYRTGDFDNAQSKADQALFIANEVDVAARNEEQTALVSSQNNVWFTILFVVFGNAIFILTLVFSWRWFKRKHANKLLNTRPEVTSE